MADRGGWITEAGLHSDRALTRSFNADLEQMFDDARGEVMLLARYIQVAQKEMTVHFPIGSSISTISTISVS